MSENQLASYANIATQPHIPNEQYDPTKGLIDRLQMLAIKPQEQVSVVEQQNRVVHEGKMSADTWAEKAQIDAQTRAMFQDMKDDYIRTLNADPSVQFEISELDRSSQEVLHFLPVFLQKLSIRHDVPKELATTLISYAIDRGMAMEHTFQERIAAEVKILNRAAFATFVLRDKERRKEELLWKYAEKRVRKSDAELELEVDKMYAFQQFDIKDFRASDFAKDEEGNHGADYTINKVATRVNKLITKINNIFITQQLDALVSVCRYGGDEVGLAFMNVSPELRKIIYAAIAGLKTEDGADINFDNGIKDVRGYFDRGGVVQEENVNIKTGIEELTIPEDPTDRAIFWEQFSLGLILDSDEIQTIRRQREEDPTIPATRKTTEIHITNREEFISYTEKLKLRHPEMIGLLDQMVELQKEIPEIMTEFPEYVNNILYDRLLGEKVTGFQDFTEHLTKGSFKEMFMFDMKGIKEFNDVQSIATGDQAIRR